MVYLVGGAPRCGKTILSKAIAKEKGVSWLSTDSIWSMITASTPVSQLKKKFPYRKYDFRKDPPETILKAEIIEAETLWPATKALIQELINRQEDYVIEGVHLMPELVRSLKGTRYWKDIRLVYLVKENIESIKDGFARNSSAHDWLVPLLKDKKIFERAARMVQVKAEHTAQQARRFHFEVVNMDTDFERKIETLSKK